MYIILSRYIVYPTITDFNCLEFIIFINFYQRKPHIVRPLTRVSTKNDKNNIKE